MAARTLPPLGIFFVRFCSKRGFEPLHALPTY
nr:MAG TPA: hypothetical protein [Caudoviricetes sp.]